MKFLYEICQNGAISEDQGENPNVPHNGIPHHFWENSMKPLVENVAFLYSKSNISICSIFEMRKARQERTLTCSEMGCAIPELSESKKCGFEENVTLRGPRTIDLDYED